MKLLRQKAKPVSVFMTVLLLLLAGNQTIVKRQTLARTPGSG